MWVREQIFSGCTRQPSNLPPGVHIFFCRFFVPEGEPVPLAPPAPAAVAEPEPAPAKAEAPAKAPPAAEEPAKAAPAAEEEPAAPAAAPASASASRGLSNEEVAHLVEIKEGLKRIELLLVKTAGN